MDQKDQIIFNLQREIELLRMENKYLRQQLQRVSNGLPIEIPDGLGLKGKQLPPLSSSNKSLGSRLISEQDKQQQVEIPIN